MTGAPVTPPAGDFGQLAIQVARLDERTAAIQRELERLGGTTARDVARIDGRLGELATKAELRAWASVIVLLLGTVLAIVLRQHGGG